MSAPAKKSKKKKIKKKDPTKDGKEEDALSLSEQNYYLSRLVESLKMELIKKSEKSAEADHTVRDLRAKLIELQNDYELQRRRTFDLSSDMTRQYKSMREELLKKISSLEEQILLYKDKLEEARLSKEDIERKKDAKIALKEAEIIEQKKKMDEMAYEFGQMLKQTLDKMSEKIEITNEWETGGNNDDNNNNSNNRGGRDNKGMTNRLEEPIVRTFEDFNLGLNRDH